MTGHIPHTHPLADDIGIGYYADDYANWTVGDLIDVLSQCNPDAPVFLAGKDGHLRPLEDFTGGPNADETILFL